MKLIEILNLLDTEQFNDKIWIGDITDLFSIIEFLNGKDRAKSYHRYFNNECNITICESKKRPGCIGCGCFSHPHMVIHYKKGNNNESFTLIVDFNKNIALLKKAKSLLKKALKG